MLCILLYYIFPLLVKLSPVTQGLLGFGIKVFMWLWFRNAFRLNKEEVWSYWALRVMCDGAFVAWFVMELRDLWEG